MSNQPETSEIAAFAEAIDRALAASREQYFAAIAKADAEDGATLEMLDAPLMEANAVLAMPEMQAIRDVLNVLDSVTMIVAPRPGQTVLDMLNLPEGVKQWGSLPS